MPGAITLLPHTPSWYGT